MRHGPRVGDTPAAGLSRPTLLYSPPPPPGRRNTPHCPSIRTWPFAQGMEQVHANVRRGQVVRRGMAGFQDPPRSAGIGDGHLIVHHLDPTLEPPHPGRARIVPHRLLTWPRRHTLAQSSDVPDIEQSPHELGVFPNPATLAPAHATHVGQWQAHARIPGEPLLIPE